MNGSVFGGEWVQVSVFVVGVSIFCLLGMCEYVRETNLNFSQLLLTQRKLYYHSN